VGLVKCANFFISLSTGEAHYLATAEQRYAELNRGYFGWTLAWDDKVRVWTAIGVP
jgi:hypothetical protein